MLRYCLIVLCVAVVCGCAPKKHAGKAKLPEAVAKAFAAEFPKGRIVTSEEGKEDGVTVYDIEFKEGDAMREADIAADGTILTAAVVVEATKVPHAAMAGIKKAAGDATIKQIEQVEIRCETKDGKVVKLEKPEMNFEAELTKGVQMAEVAVDEEGTVVEAPKWDKAKKDETK